MEMDGVFSSLSWMKWSKRRRSSRRTEQNLQTGLTTRSQIREFLLLCFSNLHPTWMAAGWTLNGVDFFYYIYILKDKHQSLSLFLQETRRTEVTETFRLWKPREPPADPELTEEERCELGHISCVFRRDHKHFNNVKTETNIQQKNRQNSDPFLHN